jgi:LCP family protein required for cell wall assembly
MPLFCPTCQGPIYPADICCGNCGIMVRPPLPGTERGTPPTSARSRSRSRRRRRAWYQKKRFMFPFMFLAFFLAAGGSAAWYVNAKFSAFNTLSAPLPGVNGEIAPAQLVLDQIAKGQGDVIGVHAARATTPGSVTILLMGVDARNDDAIDIGVNADALFVLHINKDEGTCRTLSIPRDTRANLPGYGQSKINHALSVGGVPYQILVVEQLLGIEIDHFGLLDFGGIVGVVDAVGGVSIDNERAFTYHGVTFPEGEQKLDGENARLYAKFRYDENGDFGRQERQQQIVRAVLDQTGGMDAAQAIPDVLGDIEGHFKTDLDPTTMISLANDFRSSCTSSTLETERLHGSIGSDWDELKEMDLSFVHVANGEITDKVEWLLNEPLAPMPLNAWEGLERRNLVGALVARPLHAPA